MNTINTPVKFAAKSQAYRFGAEDGELKRTCCPEQFFIRSNDKAAYCAGYAKVAGHNETTLQFTRSF